jgi:hypothetical protein
MSSVNVSDLLKQPVQADAVGGNIKAKFLTPVIYCGSSGGGPDEYAASTDPNIANEHRIKVGIKGVVAFYQPYHNIGAISQFALIDVVPDGDDVLLRIASMPGISGRLRIKITVLA